MTEYQLAVPAAIGYKIADSLFHLCQIAGGSTTMHATGSWHHPDSGERINEAVLLHVFIVDDCTSQFVDQLNDTVRALHDAGEHTVLIRRLSGRGLVHFFLTKGQEVPYR